MHNPTVDGSHSSDNTYPLYHDKDLHANRNEFVCSLPDITGGSRATFGKRPVPYKANKCIQI